MCCVMASFVPKFFFIGCIDKNTQKWKSGKNMGRPGIIRHVKVDMGLSASPWR